MDPVNIATTDLLLVNETTVTETTWHGLSCELYKMKLIMFLQFVLLIYVIFKLEKRLEKVEKVEKKVECPTVSIEEKVYRKL